MKSTELNTLISTSLLPALTNFGFTPLLLSQHSDAKSYQDKNFPFGRLIRRHNLYNGWHQIEIQVEKHNPQKFRINIGFVPEDGITHPHTGYCPPQDIWTGYLPEYACLYKPALIFKRQWMDARDLENVPLIIATLEDFIVHNSCRHGLRRVRHYTVKPKA